MIKNLKYTFILLLFWSCNNKFVKQYNALNPESKIIADTIIMNTLDREGLYTLSGNIKSISSIYFFQNKSITEIEKVQYVAKQLSTDRFTFILNPFSRKDSNAVSFELYIVNNSLLENTINKHSLFYNQLGINKLANAETILAITEYESRYNRWRSYGYLFGYPDHAVDFFVAAGKVQDSSSEFVKRNFFQIPVHKSTLGYFTYALPLDYKPSMIDSTIYNKSIQVLKDYQYLRNKYLYKNNATIKLFKKLYNQ